MRKSRSIMEDGKMSFEEDMTKALRDHLPAKMFDHVKKEMANIEGYKKEIKDLGEVVDSNLNEINKLRNLNNKLGELDGKMNALKVREEGIQDLLSDLEKRERDLTVKTLEIQLECEKSKTEHSKKILETLVRNPIFKKKVIEDKILPPDNMIHDNGYTQSSSAYTQKAESKEEITQE